MNDSRRNEVGLSDAEIQSRVLHRDGLMLVIDKPAGLPVHRGPKGGANLEASFNALRYGLPNAPVLAHRLDRDTSGCLVLGRHRKATATLGLLFKHGRIGKTYWAIVEGGPAEDEGTVDLPLGRLNEERGWWQKVDPQGLPSVTRWKVLGRNFSPPQALTAPSPHSPSKTGVNALMSGEGRGGGYPNDILPQLPPTPDPSPQGGGETSGGSSPHYTWLALEPFTGRTHQLRVHCAAMGWPIVGDVIYGDEAVERRSRNAPFHPKPDDAPLHLHAREIVIPISRNKEPVRVTAPAPLHMQELLRACGWGGE